MRNPWLVLGALAVALVLPMASGLAQQASLDPAQIEWEMKAAPQINALNLTAPQIQQLLPLLREVTQLAQTQRDEAAQAELLKLREKLLNGTAQPDDLKLLRQRLNEASKQKYTPERLELMRKITAVLTPEQLAKFERPGDQAKAARRAEKAADDPVAQLAKLRAMTPETYNQRRLTTAGAIVAQKLDPGTPQYDEAKTKLAERLDAMRALAAADFEAQKQQLAQDLVKEYGSLSPWNNEDYRRKMQERAAKTRGPVVQLEKMRAMPEEQYAQSKGQIADTVLGSRRDDVALRAKLLAKLDEVRAMTPWDFEQKKVELADAIAQEFGSLAGHGMAKPQPVRKEMAPKEPALKGPEQRAAYLLANPRTLTFLEAKLKLMTAAP